MIVEHTNVIYLEIWTLLVLTGWVTVFKHSRSHFFPQIHTDIIAIKRDFQFIVASDSSFYVSERFDLHQQVPLHLEEAGT